MSTTTAIGTTKRTYTLDAPPHDAHTEVFGMHETGTQPCFRLQYLHMSAIVLPAPEPTLNPCMIGRHNAPLEVRVARLCVSLN